MGRVSMKLGSLLFLNTRVTRLNLTLLPTIKTHTDRYLYFKSHHAKKGMIKCLYRAQNLTWDESLKEEVKDYQLESNRMLSTRYHAPAVHWRDKTQSEDTAEGAKGCLHEVPHQSVCHSQARMDERPPDQLEWNKDFAVILSHRHERNTKHTHHVRRRTLQPRQQVQAARLLDHHVKKIEGRG